MVGQHPPSLVQLVVRHEENYQALMHEQQRSECIFLQVVRYSVVVDEALLLDTSLLPR